MFTSEVYVVPITTRNFVIQIGNLRLRGDIMIRCYQLANASNNNSGGGGSALDRELLFSVQFHTCAVGGRTLVFNRKDLDYACEDPRFPEDHKVAIQFSNGADKGCVFQSPLVRTEPGSLAVTQWDSLADVNGGEFQGIVEIEGNLRENVVNLILVNRLFIAYFEAAQL